MPNLWGMAAVSKRAGMRTSHAWPVRRAGKHGRWGAAVALAVALVPGVACESSMTLGTECTTSPCALLVGDGAEPGSKDGSSGSEGDGGEPTEDTDDRGDAALDSAVDLGPDASSVELPDAQVPIGDGSVPVSAALPAFQNFSFERSKGTGSGDLNLGAEMTPWYHCLPPANLGFLRAEQNVDGVRPTEGNYFLAFGYSYVVDLPVPFYQELSVPLKAGTRYAFMVDVQSKAGDDEIGLMVRAGNVACVATTMLYSTPYVPAGRWVSQCVAFTPSEDLSQIAFLPNNRNGITVTNRFFVDNIRSDPSCQ